MAAVQGRAGDGGGQRRLAAEGEDGGGGDMCGGGIWYGRGKAMKWEWLSVKELLKIFPKKRKAKGKIAFVSSLSKGDKAMKWFSIKIPLDTTAVIYLLLDKFDPAKWVWVVVWALWIAFILMRFFKQMKRGKGEE